MELLLDHRRGSSPGWRSCANKAGSSDLMELAEFVHDFAAETRAGFGELRGIVSRQSEQTLTGIAELQASNAMLSEQQSRLTQVLTTLVEQHVDLRGTVASLAGTVATLAADQKDLRAVVADLAEGQKDLRDRVAALADDHRLLAESQRHTDERMNALIAVLDGVVRRLPPG